MRATAEWHENAAFFAGKEGDTFQRRSIATATVKNLCQQHNSSLSEIDEEAARFTRAVLRAITPRRIDEVWHHGAPPEQERFNGAMLERWALKTFVNATMSQRKRDCPLAEVGGERLSRIVFNGDPLPDWQGVYVLIRPERPIRGAPGPSAFSLNTVELTKTRAHALFHGVQVNEFQCPVYMSITFGPLHMAVCANITTLTDKSWNEFRDGARVSGNLPQGYFHVPLLSFEWHDEAAIENVFLGEIARPWPEDRYVSEEKRWVGNAEPVKGSPILSAIVEWPNRQLNRPVSILVNRWSRIKRHFDAQAQSRPTHE